MEETSKVCTPKLFTVESPDGSQTEVLSSCYGTNRQNKQNQSLWSGVEKKLKHEITKILTMVRYRSF